MNREEATQMLIGKVAGMDGVYRRMSESQAKDKTLEILKGLAVDLILENDSLKNQLALAVAYPENRAV